MKNELAEIIDNLKVFRKAGDNLGEEILDVMEKMLASVSILLDVMSTASFDSEESSIEAKKRTTEAVDSFGKISKGAFQKIDEYQVAVKGNYIPAIKLISNMKKDI